MQILAVTSALLILAFLAPGEVSGLKDSVTTTGTGYSSAYYLPDFDPNYAGNGVTFHFMVRAASDGRFKLTSTADANQSPVYINVNLGWAKNTMYGLERYPRRSDGDEIETPTNGLLSATEMRPFKLVLNGDTLSLYKGNGVQPLLVYRDSSVASLKYISFSAYHGVTAEWSLGEGTYGKVCQPLTTTGTDYTSAYYLPEMDADTTDNRLTFHFMVRAVSDARFKLSSTSDTKKSPVTIDVNLGWAKNTIYGLERVPRRSDSDEIEISTVNGLLSNSEMRQFTLVLEGQTLNLYAKNSAQPFLTFTDASVADMKYISFSEWRDTTAEWSLNCQGA